MTETRGFPEIKPVEAPAELERFAAAVRRLQDLAVSTNPDGDSWASASERIERVCEDLEWHVERIDGRKTFITATMTDLDGTVLSEANGLMIKLLPHQP